MTKTSIPPKQIGLFSILLSLALLTFLSIGCDSTRLAPADFNTFMADLNAFSQPVESTITEKASSQPSRDTEDRSLECYTKTYEGAPGFDELFTLDPTTDVIYPGALLDGASIATGEYMGISADRAPITLSVSLTGITGSPSIDVKDPNKLSNVRGAINELLSREVSGATPAQVTLTISQVYSEEHLSATVGVNYRGVGKKVSANIDFSSSQYKNVFVLKFLQRYYSLDLDFPGKKPSDLFSKLPDVDAFGGVSPVYVSSVTYGRMVLYTVETNSSMKEVKAAFDASAGSTDGSIDAKYESTISSSKIEALIVGGSGSGAVQAINGPDEVYRFIAEGGDYSKDSPGFPLAYKLRFVKPNFPVAKVVLATSYQVRECDVAYPEYRVTIDKITGTQPSDTEVNGSLSIRFLGSPNITGPKWERSKSNSVDVQNDKTHSIQKSATFRPYRPNMGIDEIEFSGQLYDFNGVFGNANLGNHALPVKLDELEPGEEEKFKINFKAGITAHFKAVRIQ